MNTRDRISEALGERFTVAGHAMWAFPTPERLLTVTETSDLGPMRVERLRAVAAAATNGALDADRLRAMGADSAIIELQELPGIGPFYAMLIAIRATGFADATPPEEGRVLVAAQRQYGDAMPDYAALVEHSKVWSPFRVWATVLLRVSEERRVH